MTASILQQSRQDGFAEGIQSQKDHQSQMSQVEYDEIYWQGRIDEERYAPSRLRWFLIGVVACALLVLMMVSFVGDTSVPSPLVGTVSVKISLTIDLTPSVLLPLTALNFLIFTEAYYLLWV